MTTAGWRRFLVGLGVFGLIQLGTCIWINLSHGAMVGIGWAATAPFFVTGSATNIPFVDKIDVAPESSAYRAGLRTGDLVDLRLLSPAERYRWFTGWWPAGQRVNLQVSRGNAVRRITLAAEFVPLNWDVWLAFFGIAWMLAFGMLIAWRRADSVEGRVLALMLIVWNVGNDFFPINWMTPSVVADAIAAVIGTALYFTGFVLFAAYAMTFARPPSPVRRVLAWLSYATAAVATFYGFAYAFGVWHAGADPTQAWYSGVLPQLAAGALPFLVPLLCVGVTLVQTRGEQLSRLAWASVPLGLVYVISIIGDGAVAFDTHLNARFMLFLINMTTIIAPLGLTYALLSRRVLDIGFALNRALVFSGVSVVVVGIFILGEWVLTEWLGRASHTANLAIGGALALGLGLSVRTIHHYVDRALDTLFFRKRHEDERAIRNFAHEAAYITDVGTLVGRTKETLEAHAGATFVTLAIEDGAGRYGTAGENDPAIVLMRAWHKAVDLHALTTGLDGEFAYPMIARGRLVGALVVGPKRSGESYAPDESDAIAHVAHAVGGAFEILTLKAGVSLESLSEQLRDLRDTIVAELRTMRTPI